MQELDAEQLQTALEDAQASLAAAFARIEAFRLREKKLMAELTELRTAVHSEHLVSHGGAATTGATLQDEQPQQQQPQQQMQSPWQGCGPLYVTKCQGQHPIHIITSSGNKVAGSLVVTPDWIDFVEVKARIHQQDFVGITTLKGVKPVSPAGRPAAPAPAASPSAAFSTFIAASNSAHPQPTTAGPTTSGAAVDAAGVWQMLWKTDDVPHRLAFEAQSNVRESLHRHTERWMGLESALSPASSTVSLSTPAQQRSVAAAATAPAASTSSTPRPPNGLPPAARVSDFGGQELQVPRNLVVGPLRLSMVGEPSAILSDAHAHALACAVPAMERMRDWGLSYSMTRHGISLQTLYRKMTHGAPSLLVVKDNGGFVFGCYTPDSWHIAPRFYGSGESFVFQVEPHRVHYPWCSLSHTKNDFFQYATPECVAMGGLGHFAIWLDAELLNGSSGPCGTFGSPCLAHKEDFRISALEVWQALG